MYWLWEGMRKRCNQKSEKSYASYGAKGITVCDEWKSFWKFLEDMGERPSPIHSLDRIDNSKGYSKENCRWATPKQQHENRRISHECYKGHKWTSESTLFVKNKKGIYRRCKICLNAYLEKYGRLKKQLDRNQKTEVLRHE